MQLPICQRYIKHKEKFDWDVKNGGIFNRFFIKRYLETLGLEDFRTLRETEEARDKRLDFGLGVWGLEDFRTLGETKDARDKMQDLGFGIWVWGLEDFRTLGKTKEARDKRQDFGLGIGDWRILGL